MEQKNEIRESWLNGLRLALIGCEAAAINDEERKLIEAVTAYTRPKQPVSECYTIGVDIRYNEDESVMTIVKRADPNVYTVACFTGKEAEDKYDLFIKELCVQKEKKNDAE